ncbi:O-methyltransferase [Marinomonas sp. TI.3.20]|uniref:O-methyltransferase n=1 Tax=Marinomonas sp. TI.3.20 TaxID=3121296 RepID=UPI00311E7622
MLNKNLMINDDLYNYILDHNPKENEFLLKLKNKTDELKYARLRSPTEQIHFLSFLLKFLNPKAILELGTFTGYSTLAFALSTKSNCNIITCDINNIFPSIGVDIWKEANVSDRITLELGPAKNTLIKLLENKALFDFIYIDADKENNWSYLEMALFLLNEDGMIIIDNVLWHGDVVKEEINTDRVNALREFNKKVMQLSNINYCLLPIADGLTIISKNKD